MTTETYDRHRQELLAAALPHVPFDGWTAKALKAGAADIGSSPVEAERHFPRGGADLIEQFSQAADRVMLERLEALDLDGMKIRERVATAVRFRLEAVEDHREAVRAGLSFFALPQNAALGLTCLYRTVDAIWHGIGDRSTDYNFYSKRLLLSGVYSSTLLYWLNDSSDEKAASWAFLERRIGEVLKVGGRFGRGMSRLLDLPERLLKARPRRRGMSRR